MKPSQIFIDGLRSIRLRIAIALLACLLCISPSAAHFANQTYLYLFIDDTSIGFQYQMAIADLNKALELELPTTKGIKAIAIDPHLDELKDYVNHHLEVEAQDHPLNLNYEGYRILETEVGPFVAVDYRATDLASIPERLVIRFTPLFDRVPDRRNFVLIADDWKSGIRNNEAGVSLIVTPERPLQSLDLSTSTYLNGARLLAQQGFTYLFTRIDRSALLWCILLLPLAIIRSRQIESANKWQNNIAVLFPWATFYATSAIGFSLSIGLDLTMPKRFTIATTWSFVGLLAISLAYPLFTQRKSLFWSLIALVGLPFGNAIANRFMAFKIPTESLPLASLSFFVGLVIAQLCTIAAVVALWQFLQPKHQQVKLLLRAIATAVLFVCSYRIIESVLGVDITLTALLRGLLQ